MADAVKEIKRAITGNGKVWYAPLKEDGSYGEVKLLGSLVESSVANNSNVNQAEAGDQVYLQTIEYGGSNVTFGVYNITKEAQCDIYGHKISENGGIIKNSNDVAPYVAVMLEANCKTETGRATDYITLYKGMLQQPEIKTKTKSKGTTEFQYYSISGSFQEREDGLYQYIQSSDDEGFNESDWKTKWGKTVIIPTEKASSGSGSVPGAGA